MVSAEQWIERVEKTQHGFTDIKQAAHEIAAQYNPTDALELSKTLLASPVPQARMLATFVLGYGASKDETCFDLLYKVVSQDADWRVQEILAQSFDRYCKDTGYQRALPMIREWLADPNANVRRAVSEGLRIWTTRPYFREHPQVAIELLSRLKEDESDYVRKSAGNALRDISRKYAELVKSELSTWDTSNKRIAQVHKLASKFLA